jgi:hypothetical protein
MEGIWWHLRTTIATKRCHYPADRGQMKCVFCGNEHDFKCPWISAYEYTDGKLSRIEFVTFADFQQQPALLSLPTHATRQ